MGASRASKNILRKSGGVAKEVLRMATGPVVKFGNYLKKVNKDVNDSYSHGARP
jgi:hypothetical protein